MMGGGGWRGGEMGWGEKRHWVNVGRGRKKGRNRRREKSIEEERGDMDGQVYSIKWEEITMRTMQDAYIE